MILPMTESRLWLFLSTPSARRATVSLSMNETSGRSISIHALREEGDGVCRPRMPSRLNFYPRPPRGGRPSGARPCAASGYFYPRPPRGGRPFATAILSESIRISIHALREEGDRCVQLLNQRIEVISIHALREEGDAVKEPLSQWLLNFYPRPPRGGRRCWCPCMAAPSPFLSTPSARRATRPRRWP